MAGRASRAPATSEELAAGDKARRALGEPGAERLDDRWLLWRPVVAGLATFAEVRDRWTILDLLDAHLVLDYREEVDRALHPPPAKK